MTNILPSFMSRITAAASLAVLLAATTGCSRVDPEPLSKVHGELENFSSQIQNAFEEGVPKDAHDALHHIGTAIKKLPEAAKQAGVRSEAEVEQVRKDLMDAFSELDGVLHGGDPVAWSDVSSKVESSFEKIESWLPEGLAHEPAAVGATVADDHDHEDHDHDDALADPDDHDHDDEADDDDHDHE